jgi:DNA helicase-2/ATP-dependent DNA helicase PcrA
MPQRFFAHQQKSNGDRHMYAARTRFITGAMLDRFESCAWPSVGAGTAGNRSTGEPVDIAMRLRRMWG